MQFLDDADDLDRKRILLPEIGVDRSAHVDGVCVDEDSTPPRTPQSPEARASTGSERDLNTDGGCELGGERSFYAGLWWTALPASDALGAVVGRPPKMTEKFQ